MGANTIEKAKNDNTWLGKYKWALFLVIVPVILIVLDCYDIPARLRYNLIVQYKSLIYIVVGLYYSAFIYISQTSSANKQCDLIVEHIKQLDGIRPNEIKEECLKWLQNENKDTRFICFYFPYSLVPCFWVDITMNNSIIKILDALTVDDNLKLMFIGPSIKTKNFQKFFDKVIREPKDIEKKFPQNPLWKYCQALKEEKNGAQIGELLTNLYKKEKRKLMDKKKDNLICVCEIKNDRFWEVAPDFSFVLRLTATNEMDILISDTFNDVNMSSFSLSSHNEISLNAILNFPKTYQITDERWKSIFTYSIFLNAVKKEKTLKNFMERI